VAVKLSQFLMYEQGESQKKKNEHVVGNEEYFFDIVIPLCLYLFS